MNTLLFFMTYVFLAVTFPGFCPPPPRPPPSSQLQLMQGTQILKHFILNLVQDLYLGICEAKASILNY